MDKEKHSADERTALLKAARGGLCGGCAAARLVRSSREGVFVGCTEPKMPKYPGQPVLRCNFYRAFFSVR